jgi:hypothetical protein
VRPPRRSVLGGRVQWVHLRPPLRIALHHQRRRRSPGQQPRMRGLAHAPKRHYPLKAVSRPRGPSAFIRAQNVTLVHSIAELSSHQVPCQGITHTSLRRSTCVVMALSALTCPHLLSWQPRGSLTRSSHRACSGCVHQPCSQRHEERARCSKGRWVRQACGSHFIVRGCDLAGVWCACLQQL